MPRAGGIIIQSDTLRPGIVGFQAELSGALDVLMKYEAPQVQSYMRTNAPWTDRTGNARQGLFAKPESEGFLHKITCFGSVPYQIWLEVRHSGRYAIIGPTIKKEGRRVMRDVRGLIRRMR
jgi:hypothetical protein